MHKNLINVLDNKMKNAMSSIIEATSINFNSILMGSCGSSGFGGSCESDWLGGSGSLVGIFFLFDLIQKYFQMELLSFMTHKNLMIPKPLVV